MLHVRRELLWDYDVPPHPEADDGFMAVYVGRVLDQGTDEDIRDLGLPLIRRYLEVAPVRREVADFWRWWLAVRDRSDHGSPDGGAAPVPDDRRGGGDRQG
ncbi:MAG: hypothetical protein HY906_09910 [Deltaproteobacteria bacterium]|nr:hypothetical protein [Deltaproteobacteria bacterium]